MRSIVCSFCLVLCTIGTVVGLSTESSGSLNISYPFKAWDNYFDHHPSGDPKQYLIGPKNRTQTGRGCHTNGCKDWTQGLFPSVNASGYPINGGIPQRANVSLHLDLLRAQVVHWVPDPTWEMHGVLDFEAWTPVWEENTGRTGWHSHVYQNLSLEYALEQDPSLAMNRTLWVATAKQQFETAAVHFFVVTLKTLAEMRPAVRWGFYGLPSGAYGWQYCHARRGGEYPATLSSCGVFNSYWGPVIRAQNDRLAAVWRHTGAFYPSVYLPPRGSYSPTIWKELQHQYVLGVANETARLSSTYPSLVAQPRLAPVLPFFWPLYHNGTTAVAPEDLRALIRNVYLPPLVTQLIVWSGNEKAIPAALAEISGPIIRNATVSAEACSRAHCGGAGWCTNAEDAFPFSSNGSFGGGCVCFPGFDGPSCTPKR